MIAAAQCLVTFAFRAVGAAASSAALLLEPIYVCLKLVHFGFTFM
jgi:hypothetical protein